MILKVAVRIMYALVFGGQVAYIAHGLFHDGRVSAGFGGATVVVCGVWNLRRITVPRDRRLGRTGTRISRFMVTRTGLAVMAAALALVLVKIGAGGCPSRDFAGTCRLPSHMNW